MAKKNDENIELTKVKALVFLKYNTDYIVIGQEFGVNKDDLEEMGEKGLIEKGEEIPNDVSKLPGEDTNIPKEGE